MTQQAATASVVASSKPAVQVTAEDRFQFDAHGFLILRGALADADRLALLEETRRQEALEHDDSRWRRTLPNGRIGQLTKIVQPGFLRLNGLLRMSPVFDRIIDYPTVMPYLEEFMTDPQLGNTWTITKTLGNDTGAWHRGIEPDLYSVRNGRIRARMLNTVYFLTENGPEDGCMLTVPGAHKSDIDLPWGKYNGLDLPGSIRIVGQPGDVLIFSESLIHNGLGNTSGRTRTNVYANYVARDYNVATYSPEHNFHFIMPPSIRARLTERQKRATAWMEHAASIE